MINLTEPLFSTDHVSHGLKSDAIEGTHLNTIDPGSRDRNNELRGIDQYSGGALFDQILIPGWMSNCYIRDSARGNNKNRASDHVPVHADFVLPQEDAEGATVQTVSIIALPPNPDGSDRGREEVHLRNDTTSTVSLDGWRIVGSKENTVSLEGDLLAGATRVVVLPSAILNSTGDTVRLLAPGSSHPESEVSYGSVDATSGSIVWF